MTARTANERDAASARSPGRPSPVASSCRCESAWPRSRSGETARIATRFCASRRPGTCAGKVASPPALAKSWRMVRTALRIETFSNSQRRQRLFQGGDASAGGARGAGAAGPAGRGPGRGLRSRRAAPTAFAELYDLGATRPRRLLRAGRRRAIGRTVLGRAAQPVTETRRMPARDACFVAGLRRGARRRCTSAISLPAGAEAASLDAMRLPDELLTNRARYLDPLNFATNFVFFRDAARPLTRGSSPPITGRATARGDGAVAACCSTRLARRSAEWRETVAPGVAAIVLDSREIRRRFALARIHRPALPPRGRRGRPRRGEIRARHFRRATPGRASPAPTTPIPGRRISMPACRRRPRARRVTLWVQNSQPCAIPAGRDRAQPHGRCTRSRRSTAPSRPSPPTRSTSPTLLPEARWPQQIEMRAGKYFVRPRYEVQRAGPSAASPMSMSSAPISRPIRASPSSAICSARAISLPAPVLPRDALPLAGAADADGDRRSSDLPVALVVYDRAGREVARQRFGRARAAPIGRRSTSTTLLNGTRAARRLWPCRAALRFQRRRRGRWLAARRSSATRHRASGHAAETSFGAHVFNTVLTYKGEPQSYSGRAPGLSTRLFLRLGDGAARHALPSDLSGLDAVARDERAPTSCCTTAPAPRSRSVAVAIPCSGSLFWRYHETVRRGDAGAGRRRMPISWFATRPAGFSAIMGFSGAGGAFSLDHMFGF